MDYPSPTFSTSHLIGSADEKGRSLGSGTLDFRLGTRRSRIRSAISIPDRLGRSVFVPNAEPNQRRFTIARATCSGTVFCWFAKSSVPVYSGFRMKSNDRVGLLLLNLAQICVQPVEIPAELGVELASRFASLCNEWIFHEITLPSD